jgi:hypothetical protein
MEKIEEAQAGERQAELKKEQEKASTVSRRSVRQEKSMIEEISSNTMVRQVGRTVARELTRGLLGVLGVKPRSTRRRKSSFW